MATNCLMRLTLRSTVAKHLFQTPHRQHFDSPHFKILRGCLLHTRLYLLRQCPKPLLEQETEKLDLSFCSPFFDPFRLRLALETRQIVPGREVRNWTVESASSRLKPARCRFHTGVSGQALTKSLTNIHSSATS
jgi:hypothetical protein